MIPSAMKKISKHESFLSRIQDIFGSYRESHQQQQRNLLEQAKA
jgi:hypothetical protein